MKTIQEEVRKQRSENHLVELTSGDCRSNGAAERAVQAIAEQVQNYACS